MVTRKKSRYNRVQKGGGGNDSTKKLNYVERKLVMNAIRKKKILQ